MKPIITSLYSSKDVSEKIIDHSRLYLNSSYCKKKYLTSRKKNTK